MNGGARLLLRTNAEAEPSCLPADPIVQAQQLETGERRASGYRRSHVDRIERSDRLARKRTPRAFHNLRAHSQNAPMKGRLREQGSPVAWPRFASATIAPATSPPAAVWPGGDSSATTSPRSVTSTVSPDRTCLM